MNIATIVSTTLKHILSGTILPYFAWNILPKTPAGFMPAFAVGLATSGILAFGLRSLRDLPHRWVVALIAALFAIYVSLPTALTLKQQGWCEGVWKCAYLDSRTSYYGVAVFLCAAASFWISGSSARRHPRFTGLLVCAIFGVLSGATYLQNQKVARDMQTYVSIWERASALACDPKALADTDAVLISRIDPDSTMSHHWDFRVAEYWRKYITDRAQQFGCTGTGG